MNFKKTLYLTLLVLGLPLAIPSYSYAFTTLYLGGSFDVTSKKTELSGYGAAHYLLDLNSIEDNLDTPEDSIKAPFPVTSGQYILPRLNIGLSFANRVRLSGSLGYVKSSSKGIVLEQGDYTVDSGISMFDIYGQLGVFIWHAPIGNFYLFAKGGSSLYSYHASMYGKQNKEASDSLATIYYGGGIGIDFPVNPITLKNKSQHIVSLELSVLGTQEPNAAKVFATATNSISDTLESNFILGFTAKYYYSINFGKR